MTTYARIENGKVVEIGNFDGIEGRFHLSLTWVPCVLEVQVGWLYNGTQFTQYVRPRADIEKDKIAETKAEAQRRIYARYPQWKQANMQARFNELNAIEQGRYRDGNGALQLTRALTSSEIAEIGGFSTAWEWIKSVRVASGLIEQDVQVSTDPSNFNVAGSARWPA